MIIARKGGDDVLASPLMNIDSGALMMKLRMAVNGEVNHGLEVGLWDLYADVRSDPLDPEIKSFPSYNLKHRNELGRWEIYYYSPEYSLNGEIIQIHGEFPNLTYAAQAIKKDWAYRLVDLIPTYKAPPEPAVIWVPADHYGSF